MRLRSNLSFLPLDDEFVVFSEEAQSLVGLNASAAYIAQQLQAGSSPASIAHALAQRGSTSAEEAANWIAVTLEALRQHGMSADTPLPEPSVSQELRLQQQQQAQRTAIMPPYAPVAAVAERRYRLLNTVFLMRFAASGQAEAVDAALGHLQVAESAGPHTLLEVQAEVHGAHASVRSYIYCDGKPVDFTTGLYRLAPTIKSLLWKETVNHHEFLFYIHAGVVGMGDRCILLPAAAGSGKSSLTAALVHRGYRYLSDEVALIEPGSFRVPPVPLAVCVKSTAWDLMSRYFPNIRALMRHERMDGKHIRYVAPAPAMVQRSAAQVSHIVFPSYGANVETQLRPIARSVALSRMMSECWACGHLDRTNVSELIRWIMQIDCYELPFSSLEEAADLVQQVAPLEAP